MKGYIIVFFIFFVFGLVTDVIEEFGGIDDAPVNKPKQQSLRSKDLKQQGSQIHQYSNNLNSQNTKSVRKKKKKSRKHRGKYLKTNK